MTTITPAQLLVGKSNPNLVAHLQVRTCQTDDHVHMERSTRT